MAARLVVSLNGASQLEFDRGRLLQPAQLQALEGMDREMDAGITLDGRQIEQPDPLARAHFVALHLIRALREGQEQRAAMTCAYLATRIPELRQVQIRERDGAYDYGLVFERDFAPEEPVKFVPPESFKPGEQ